MLPEDGIARSAEPVDLAREIAAGAALILSMPKVAEFELIGSATYMPEADVGDVDFAVLLDDGNDALQYLTEMRDGGGWQLCSEYDSAEGLWGAARQGRFNLMLTHDRKFYDGYLRAMEVCKALNLQSKDDRIAVCRIVRDGCSAVQVRPFAAFREAKVF